MTTTSETRIPLPARVYKKDRKFQDGLFVAANTLIDPETGKALFGQTQGVEEMQRGRRCQLCGQRIAKDQFACFPGDYGRTKYQEAPLHIECARYSLQVCPFILKKAASGPNVFGVAVTMTYHYVPFEPPLWLDKGCVPDWAGLPEWRQSVLLLAHNPQAPDDEHENWWCATCPGWGGAGHMTYREFMAWSGKYM